MHVLSVQLDAINTCATSPWKSATYVSPPLTIASAPVLQESIPFHIQHAPLQTCLGYLKTDVIPTMSDLGLRQTHQICLG